MMAHADAMAEAGTCHIAPGDIAESAVLALAVNPEARVYATVERHAVHLGQVETVLSLPVTVVNSGLVTAAIQPVLLAPTDGSVELIWDPIPLAGEDREDRVLGVITHNPGYSDVTIGFSFPGEPPDLGGRDRVNLLVNSSPRPAARSRVSLPAVLQTLSIACLMLHAILILLAPSLVTALMLVLALVCVVCAFHVTHGTRRPWVSMAAGNTIMLALHGLPHGGAASGPSHSGLHGGVPATSSAPLDLAALPLADLVVPAASAATVTEIVLAVVGITLLTRGVPRRIAGSVIH